MDLMDTKELTDNGEGAIALVSAFASMTPEEKARRREESRQRWLKAQEERKAYLAEHPLGRAATRRLRQMERLKEKGGG